VHDDCCGLILDGGQARRFQGRHKAFLEVDGKPIAERTVELFAELFPETLVATNQPEAWDRFAVRCVQDAVPKAGPLAGIAGGLLASRQELIFVVAGDMPSLSKELIEDLLARARLRPGSAIVPLDAGARPEPLHAVYPKLLGEPARRSLGSGTRKITDFLKGARTTWVPEDEWSSVEGADASFRNVNRPEDLEPRP
jgi:molybdopterin-guanine dinucleotide biosynthesis protein A